MSRIPSPASSIRRVATLIIDSNVDDTPQTNNGGVTLTFPDENLGTALRRRHDRCDQRDDRRDLGSTGRIQQSM
jgi:hypothetical protein